MIASHPIMPPTKPSKEHMAALHDMQVILATARIGIHPDKAQAHAALQAMDAEQRRMQQDGMSARHLDGARSALAGIAGGYLPTTAQCVDAVLTLRTHEQALEEMAQATE